MTEEQWQLFDRFALAIIGIAWIAVVILDELLELAAARARARVLRRRGPQ